MSSIFERVKRKLGSSETKAYFSALVLFVNALIAVAVATRMYRGRLELPASAQTVYSEAILVTNYGNITIKFNKKAPNTVDQFARLARSNFYEGTKFHRVVSDLLIEGGDPLSKRDDLKSKWGNGSPGYVYNDEISPDDKMLRGVVGIVNNGPNTNGSQFFILVKDSTWLNGQNTILGKVEEGMDVVDKISKVPAGVTSIPLTNIILESVLLK